MRRAMWLAAAIMAFAMNATAFAGDAAWFDMNCSMCKHFMEQPGLMEAMQHESHSISNGCIMVTTVDAAHEEAYMKASQACEVTGGKLMAGEQMPLCGMCTAIGQSMMAGAKMDMVDTDAGHLMVMTSSDPKVVEQLHMIVKRNNEEAEKMMKQG